MDDDALVQNVMERQWTRGRQWSTSRTETRTTVAADGIATISTGFDDTEAIHKAPRRRFSH